MNSGRAEPGTADEAPALQAPRYSPKAAPPACDGAPMTLTRRSLTLARTAASFATPAAAQALSSADKAAVDRAVAYLEGLTEAKARFVQIDPRGRSSGGDLFMKRPGKARFAYDAP